MTEFIVDVNDTLTKISKYELIRGGGQRIPIEVHKFIAGIHGSPFIAIPVRIVTARQQYFGKGHSEEEALQDCINLISGVPFTKIFGIQGDSDPNNKSRG